MQNTSNFSKDDQHNLQTKEVTPVSHVTSRKGDNKSNPWIDIVAYKIAPFTDAKHRWKYRNLALRRIQLQILQLLLEYVREHRFEHINKGIVQFLLTNTSIRDLICNTSTNQKSSDNKGTESAEKATSTIVAWNKKKLYYEPIQSLDNHIYNLFDGCFTVVRNVIRQLQGDGGIGVALDKEHLKKIVARVRTDLIASKLKSELHHLVYCKTAVPIRGGYKLVLSHINTGKKCDVTSVVSPESIDDTLVVERRKFGDPFTESMELDLTKEDVEELLRTLDVMRTPSLPSKVLKSS